MFKVYDMSCEWVLILVFGLILVFVFIVYGFCESFDVMGVWFYVMGWVNGKFLYMVEDISLFIFEIECCKVVFLFIDVFVDFYSVDLD